MNAQPDSTDPSSGSARRATAVALSFLAPGLGLAYVGRLVQGLVVNLSFILLVLVFVVASGTLQFFPVYPALVLVGAWLLCCALSGWRAADLIEDGAARRSKSYQHPLIYILIALLSFGAPLAVIGHFTERHLLTAVSVKDTSMIPHVRGGERVLVDRTEFQNDGPERGQLIAVDPPELDDPRIVRVVAVPTDRVHMQGYTLAINDDLVSHSSFEDAGADRSDLDAELWIEDNHGVRYVVATVPGQTVDATLPEFQVEADEYFVLTDNRSFTDDHDEAPVDSRAFGTIHQQHIVGRPLYIGWSNGPDSALPRFDRIGLALE